MPNDLFLKFDHGLNTLLKKSPNSLVLDNAKPRQAACPFWTCTLEKSSNLDLVQCLNNTGLLYQVPYSYSRQKWALKNQTDAPHPEEMKRSDYIKSAYQKNIRCHPCPKHRPFLHQSTYLLRQNTNPHYQANRWYMSVWLNTFDLHLRIQRALLYQTLDYFLVHK